MKSLKLILIVLILILLAVSISPQENGTKEKPEYIECLVKTGDNIHSKLPKENWTQEMFEEERRGNAKQGYIVIVKPEGWDWGSSERDPKKFAIVKIPKSEWNDSWLEPEYDYEKPFYDPDDINNETILGYEVKTQRKYRLPLENFLTSREIVDFKNKQLTTINKDITDIKTKMVAVDWDNKPVDIILHGSSGTFEICVTNATGQCNYSSIGTWLTGEEADLTASGPCIANITENFTESTSSFSIYGWTTTATDYIKIVAAKGTTARHDGKWDDSAFIWMEGGDSIRVSEDFVRFEGLQINQTSAGGTCGLRLDNSGSGAELHVSHCLITSAKSAIRGFGSGVTFKFWNNVLFDIGGYGIYPFVSGTYYIYSNSIINTSDDGIRFRGDTHYVNNTLVTGSIGDNFLFTAGTTYISYSATQDSTADDQGGVGNRPNSNFTFVDSENKDFHLASTDVSALDRGTDLSSDANLSFSDDIDGETRPGGSAWDIGADEYISLADETAPTFSTTSINNTNPENDTIQIGNKVTDETSLSMVIFAWNETGTWLNVSNSSVVPDPTLNLNYTVNVSITALGGTVIGVQFYANDTSNNWGSATMRTITVATPAVDSCSCPASGDFEIINGDQCTLSTVCDVRPNSFRVLDGAMKVLANGYLRADGCFIKDGENFYVDDNGGFFCG